MTAIQLDFFQTPEESEIEALRKEVKNNFNRQEAVRKGTYARLNEQGKEIEELKERLNIIERNVCHG